jgi:hypothetical protein
MRPRPTAPSSMPAGSPDTAAPAPVSQPMIEKQSMPQASARPAQGPTPEPKSESAVSSARPGERQSALPEKTQGSVEAKTDRPGQPTFTVVRVDRDDVLNVRSGPSADFDVVGELPPGSRGVTIAGACQSSWCPVRHRMASGWVNRIYLTSEQPVPVDPIGRQAVADVQTDRFTDPPYAPRSCLTPAARMLLERIEQKFGPVQLVATCRPGAVIAGTGRPSRHASGNAIDFKAGGRKASIVEWLIENHRDGGTMTYADMDHIHVDIGPHFVSIAGGRHWASWRDRDVRSGSARWSGGG